MDVNRWYPPKPITPRITRPLSISFNSCRRISRATSLAFEFDIFVWSLVAPPQRLPVIWHDPLLSRFTPPRLVILRQTFVRRRHRWQFAPYSGPQIAAKAIVSGTFFQQCRGRIRGLVFPAGNEVFCGAVIVHAGSLVLVGGCAGFFLGERTVGNPLACLIRSAGSHPFRRRAGRPVSTIRKRAWSERCSVRTE